MERSGPVNQGDLLEDGEFVAPHTPEAASTCPEFTLRFGEDSIYADQIFAAMIAKLEEAGLYTPNLLFSGISRTEQTKALNTFWAYTEAENRTRAEETSHYEKPAHEYAFQATESDDGTPVVDVYDISGVKVEEFEPLHYQLDPGITTDTIRIASFILIEE